ncbi:MAG: GAF domain-containing protein, partial [bacterium]
MTPYSDQEPSSSDDIKVINDYSIPLCSDELSFENFTRLTRSIFDVSIAHIAFFHDNKQWFKSTMGINFSDDNKECPFCKDLARRKQSFVVNDTTSHQSYRNYSIGSDTRDVQFYAGAPLLTEDGQVLGSLCIMDTDPREFSSREHNILRRLATEIMNQIKL